MTRGSGSRSGSRSRSGSGSGSRSRSGPTSASTGAPGRVFHVRRARLADAPQVAAVMRAAVRGAAGAYPARTLAAWGALPPLYHAWAMTAGGESVLVAERAGAALGYAALRGAELTALFVRPSAARRGVASALLARVEALARRRGVARLRVDAARSGVAFYRARGFAGTRPVSVPLPGGAALPAVRMTKALRPPRTARR